MPSLRVATWNIHGSIGADGKPSPERIVRIIQSFGADIVVLQEVDGRQHLRRKAGAFEEIGGLLGGQIVEARLIGKPGQEHGNLLWSRLSIARSAVHLLPGGLEQRGLIEAEISMADGSPLRIFGTHLGLSPLTRRRQAQAVLRYVEERPIPAVLMGDLNEWRSGGGVHRQFRRLFSASLRPHTFPARRPLAALDRIYATEGVRLTALEVPAEAITASDHLPVIAEIGIG